MIFSGRMVLFRGAGASDEVVGCLTGVLGIDRIGAGKVASVLLEDDRIFDNVPILPNRAAAAALLAEARPVAYLLS